MQEGFCWALTAHLSTEERNTINNMLQQGKSKPQIAAAIQRHPTTVWRECRRNSLADGDYSAAFAERFAQERKSTKPSRSAMSSDFIRQMEQGLANHYSPEQIVGRLNHEGHSQVPCFQTVYNHIHRERKKGGAIHRKLRHRGRKRKLHGQGKQRRASIPGRRDIEERPAIVEERSRFGDLECDLIIGANQSGAIVTVNDRATGLAWMVKIKDKQAGTVRAALIALLAPLRGKIHSITSDNGKEFALHNTIREELDCEWYFAKPYHSWERGSNENFNGLVRDYFPKGMEFHNLQQREVAQVNHALNHRPRKRYKFLSPTEFHTQNFNKLDAHCISN